MSDPFASWTLQVVVAGMFLVFTVHFGKFVCGEVWPVVGPLVQWLRRWW